MKTQTIDAKLLFAQNAIENALNVADLQAALAVFGYNKAKIEEGKALYTKAQDLQNKQVKEYGEQFAATDTLQLAKANANKQYMIHLKIARIALKSDRGAEESLQMSGDRKDSLSGWLKQAKAFYSNALSTPSVTDALGKFNIKKNNLQEAQKEVEAVESALNQQLKEKGEAQAATEARDKALDDLQAWIRDLVAIAKIALEDQKQLLEVLGVVEG